jgi:hypothetical protein
MKWVRELGWREGMCAGRGFLCSTVVFKADDGWAVAALGDKAMKACAKRIIYNPNSGDNRHSAFLPFSNLLSFLRLHFQHSHAAPALSDFLEVALYTLLVRDYLSYVV